MKKELTIDFSRYIEEHQDSQRKGFKDGVGEARRVFLELLAGASIEDLDVDDEVLIKLARDLEPRIRQAKIIAKGEV